MRLKGITLIRMKKEKEERMLHDVIPEPPMK